MRRIPLGLIVLVTVLALIGGCATSEPVLLTEDDSGRSVTIPAGEELVVELPANPTTGFRWMVTGTGPLEQRGESVYDAPEEPGVVGQGGVETFRFSATGSGTGDLALEYRRPWETDIAAEETWTVEVSVE